jgi:protease IV
MAHRGIRAVAAAALALSVTSGDVARAQSADDWVALPTDGLYLPAIPLAGEHDALSVSVNPAGVALLRGGHVALGLDLAGEEAAAGLGRGIGFFAATDYAGGLLPRLGIGVGFEGLRPPGEPFAEDTGTPMRFSLANAIALSDQLAVGVAYRHFFGDGPLSGVGSWDLGVSSRWGAHLGVGLAVRDLNAPSAGDLRAQRRYEIDFNVRPTGTDALELGAGGRLGEPELSVDGWLRAAVRIGRGAWLHAGYLSRELVYVGAVSERDHRLTAGLELSFGQTSAALYGSGASRGGERRAVGATAIVRASGERAPSLTGEPRRLERLEIGGAYGEREHGRMVARLRRLARDPAVVAVLVEIGSFGGGWATAQELHEELATLAAAGTRVYAHLVSGGLREYFVATAADQIFVDPAGGLRMAGIAGTRLYYGEILERIGVQAQFLRIAEYKTAPEVYTRTGPTPEAVEVRTRIFDSLYAQLEGTVARQRGIPRARARELIEGGPYTSGDLAKLPELVDGVLIPEQVEALIAGELGAGVRERREPRRRPDRWQHPAIAIIYLHGDIVSGESRTIPILNQRLVGDETIVEAIRRARLDPRIGAIVLRINSPGGSALASEMMAREVFKTRGVKPILCSMGDVAASGGYFAAAGCDLIVAEPTTVTGSIGIFTGKVDASELLARLGFYWSVEKRGDRADMESLYRPYSEQEQALIEDKLGYYYERFLSTVARGRGMILDEVHEVARGRVFTAADAARLGLVDELGGLGSALAEARRRAGIRPDVPVRVIELPQVRPGLLGRLLGLGAAGAGAPANHAPPGLGALLDAIPASLWAEPDAVQARLPYQLRLE